MPEILVRGHRPLGCLLVHGFTGTPDEMAPLAEGLGAAGFTALAVRLEGHGTTVADLARCRWGSWFRSVEEGTTRLAGLVPRVAVAGLSMGGLLALHLAATGRTRIEGLVLLATALRLADRRGRWLRPLGVAPWATRRWLVPKSGGRDIGDPAMRAASPSYDEMPLSSVVELIRLQHVVRRELPRVTQPALLLHGRHDHSVPVAQLDELRRGLGSRDVEAHVLERSWHVVTVDHDRDEVIRRTVAFLDRVDAAGR
jgi:carboxylesterase